MTHSYHMIPPNKAERAAGPMRDPLCGCVSWRSNPRSVWMRESPIKHGGKSGILGVGHTQYMHIPILSMMDGFFIVKCRHCHHHCHQQQLATAINQSIMSVCFILFCGGPWPESVVWRFVKYSTVINVCENHIASFWGHPFEYFDPDGKSSARF